jgi:hypothetical protein
MRSENFSLLIFISAKDYPIGSLFYQRPAGRNLCLRCPRPFAKSSPMGQFVTNWPIFDACLNETRTAWPMSTLRATNLCTHQRSHFVSPLRSWGTWN